MILPAFVLGIALSACPVAPDQSEPLRGAASWYCVEGRSACTRGHPDGLYAAAGPDLRETLGDWRGQRVDVCHGIRCVTVTLIDWCACRSRLIDLYGDAFIQLAPLSRGLVRVTIERTSQEVEP